MKKLCFWSGKDESSVVYYADGVHPTHNSRSTYAWIEKGEQFEQPTVSGRDRVNIHAFCSAAAFSFAVTLQHICSGTATYPS